MTKVKHYATLDCDGERIEENAEIVSFDSREGAEDHLRGGYLLEEGDTLDFEEGRDPHCFM